MFYSKKISGLVVGVSMNVDEGVETVSSLKPSPSVDEGVETVSSLKPSPAGVRGTSPSPRSSSLSDDAFAPEVDATVNER